MKKGYRMSLALIAILIAVCIYTGFTYAAWTTEFVQSTDNHIVAGCFSMSFIDGNNSINVNNAYPVDDAKGLQSDPYTFQISNSCTIYGKYQILLDIKNTTTIDLSKIKVALESDGTLQPTILSTLEEIEYSEGNYITSYLLQTDGLDRLDASKNYSLKVWIDSAAGNEVMGQGIHARVRIISVAGEAPPPTLNDLILAQGGGAPTIEAKGNPAFNAVPTSSTSGLYATPDEYGTSYYYRGERNSLNNNIIFAGFQWKIVRINGDESIRLIYNGTEAQFNSANTMNTTGANTEIGTVEFNSTSNDNRYVGYMYGTSATTKELAQTNTNDSTIKAYLDNWYVTQILTQGTSITNKIVDNLFCNDRSITSGSGAGTTTTDYKPYTRHQTNASNPTPTLMCEQKNDRFTVSETTIGNGSLTYPIGLLSADELTYAGTTRSYYNTNQYLYTNQYFWLLSPNSFRSGNASVWNVYYSGYLTGDYTFNTGGARPSINLASGTQVTGVGSATDPYKVVD